mgnify:CR=1|jgi:hypothetical protein
MIRSIVALALLSTSLSLSAAKADLDMLQGMFDSEHNQVILSTQDIPNKAAVVVHCRVSLPWYYTIPPTNYLYVVPQAGLFGQIEHTYAVENFSWFFDSSVDSVSESTDSKILPPPDSSSFNFSITQVKQANEAIIIDLNHIPYDTTTSCWF